MAERMNLMVFCYDISDDRMRRRVAAIFEEHAVRVQGSVFEARMTPRRASRLAEEAARHLDPGDSLRLYAITAHGRPHCQSWGATPISEAEDFYLF